MNSSRHDSSNLFETWEQFKSSRGRELQNWVEAERALVQARAAGGSDTAHGDRLMVAEAALQGAIVDFAASQNGGVDPTPIALGLLRLAEDALADGAGIASARLGRQRGIDGRRRHRPER